MLRIAMWSGPRNISTAMMRSWGNRADTVVVDEPLYAHYLRSTGVQHPGADEVMACGETDWHRVVADLVRDIPQSRPIYYQKHMAHHLLPHIDRGWLSQVENCFLIRDPYEMLTSLIKNLPEPRLEDTGLPQQVEIFNDVYQRGGRTPPVLDARDVLCNPPRLLTLLCESLDVAFDPAMLSWPAGPRDTDGVWARHWYHAVEASTRFQPYKPKNDCLPTELEPLYRRCREYYDELYARRLGQ